MLNYKKGQVYKFPQGSRWRVDGIGARYTVLVNLATGKQKTSLSSLLQEAINRNLAKLES